MDTFFYEIVYNIPLLYYILMQTYSSDLCLTHHMI